MREKNRRLIEEFLPTELIGKVAQKEKSNSRKTLSALHLWWARRPLTLSRAAIAASILDAPNDERELRKLQEIFLRENGGIEGAWTLNAGSGRKKPALDLQNLLKMIEKRFPKGRKLRLLDPFSGGGSIPFESRRLGLDTFGNDLNPVSYIVRKVGVELIPEIWNEDGTKGEALLKQFDQWTDWLYSKVHAELKDFYDPNTLAYLWVKTGHCKSCGREVPLLSMRISRNKGKIVNPQVIVDKHKGTFDIVISDKEPDMLRTRKGVVCPFCNTLTTTLNDIKEEGKKNGLGQFPICKYIKDGTTRSFVRFSRRDIEQEKAARARLNELRKDPEFRKFIPTEKAPETGSGSLRGFSNTMYGYDTFDKFYSPRQLLAICTLMKYVSQAYDEMQKQGIRERRAKLLTLLLAFIVDKIADFGNIFTSWNSNKLHIRNIFASADFRMSWDYAESNPTVLEGGGSFGSAKKTVKDAMQNSMTEMKGNYKDNIGSITQLPYEDEEIDLVVTDPPYYDYIGYSYLSDFFYVLLKRMVKNLVPEAFKTPLAPKKNELILTKKTEEKIRELEKGLLQAWKEVNRVLKQNGLLVVMFTHKETKAWNQLFQTLYNAGFYVTATWPIYSELKTRFTQGRGNVNVTLLIVCRKRDPLQHLVGDFNELHVELRKVVYKKAERFWNLGYSQSDFFVILQGPVIEVFGKYDRVERPSGENVTLEEFIQISQRVVSQYVMEKLLHSQKTNVDDISQFYLIWRWAFGVAPATNDDFLLLCKANGIDQSQIIEQGYCEKRKIKGSISIYLRQYYERDLPIPLWREVITREPIVTQLQFLLAILENSPYSEFKEAMKILGIQDGSHPLISYAKALEVILRPVAELTTIKEYSLLIQLLDHVGIRPDRGNLDGKGTGSLNDYLEDRR